jgi:hypothetical protein
MLSMNSNNLDDDGDSELYHGKAYVLDSESTMTQFASDMPDDFQNSEAFDDHFFEIQEMYHVDSPFDIAAWVTLE